MNKERFMDGLGQIANEYDCKIKYEFVSDLETGVIAAECEMNDVDMTDLHYEFTLEFVNDVVLTTFPASRMGGPIVKAVCNHPKAVFGLLYL